MEITSVRFALFAAALLILYYTLARHHQWQLLLGASLVFYLWAGPEYAVFLGITILSTYAVTLAMARNWARTPQTERAAGKRKNRPILLACLTVNFGMLLLCKAALTEPLRRALQGGGLSFLTLGLPMGISFYLFQTMGYVIDVSRGTVPAEKNIGRLALFSAFFPQLIQGPISRYGALSTELYKAHPFDPKQVSFGAQRMLWGYFKKLVIADRVAPAVAALRDDAYTGWPFALLTVLYALQIYADFTGGIDIALSLSQMLGITLPENFRRPFFSRNIAEYWRRWHITLGEWMKEYLFYPVSVSKPMLRLGRAARKKWPHFGKRLPVYGATLVTWLATGIWHGLTPNFILWGLMNCAVIVISEELTPLYRRFHARFHLKEKGWYGVFEMLRMFVLMNFIRVCDLFPDVGAYFRRLGTLFLPYTGNLALGLTAWDWGILVAGTALMLAVSLMQERRGSVREWLWERPELRWTLLFALFLAVLLMGRYGVGYEAASFVYNQF